MIPKIDPDLREECFQVRAMLSNSGLFKQAAEVGEILKQAEEDSIKEHRLGAKAIKRTFEAAEKISKTMASIPETASNADLCSAIEKIQSDFEAIMEIRSDAPSFLKKVASKIEIGVWQLAKESAVGDLKDKISDKAKKTIGELSGDTWE